MITIKEDLCIVIDGKETSVASLIEENDNLKRELAQYKVMVSDIREIMGTANRILEPTSNADIVKAIEVDLVQQSMD